jgi:two-component system sensor histidine kinase KdpD
LITLAIITVSAITAVVVKATIGLVTAALVLVLGITLAGAFCGLAAALIAAAATFLLYSFYLTEPVLSFGPATARTIAPLVVFNLCAIITGILAGLLKERAQAASRSNLNLAKLLETSQALQSAVRTQDVAVIVSKTVPEIFGRVQLFQLKDDALLPLDEASQDDAWRAVADTARLSPSRSVRDGSLVGYRLDGSEGPVGVMVVDQVSPNRFDFAFMAALANLIALAIERAMLSELISEGRAAARTEQLKTALLSSVSHDLRTPLTAISASASSLIDYREQLDQDTTRRLLRGIVDDCERLNRYTANLLEMSRLETGQTLARVQTLGVVEILSAVIQRVRARAGNRRIERVSTDPNLLVKADTALFELVMLNILDNAILYSDDGTRISIEARAENESCMIIVADEGQGIPPGDLNRIFRRFYRVPRAEPSPRGSGLGLAIAKGFVEVLGGRIAARSPGIGDKGTRIIIHLPLAEEIHTT